MRSRTLGSGDATDLFEGKRWLWKRAIRFSAARGNHAQADFIGDSATSGPGAGRQSRSPGKARLFTSGLGGSARRGGSRQHRASGVLSATATGNRPPPAYRGLLCGLMAWASARGSSTVAMPRYGARRGRAGGGDAFPHFLVPGLAPWRSARRGFLCDCAGWRPAARRGATCRFFWPPRISSLGDSHRAHGLKAPACSASIHCRMSLVHLATPSVSAAGPGCRMSGDLISNSWLVAHRVHRAPALTRRHVLGPEFLAAPGAQDDVGVAPHDLGAVRNDAVLAQRLARRVQGNSRRPRRCPSARTPSGSR